MPKCFDVDALGLKPGNGARICWHLGEGERTEAALLYLHGFTGSPGEAGNLPDQMAAALGANLYAHRWPGHGLISHNAMKGLTFELLQASASDALSTARELGKSVIIVGSSLGAALGLCLAASRPADVAALVAWSPGLRPANPELLDQLCAAEGPVNHPRLINLEAARYSSDVVHPDGYRALRKLFDFFVAAPPWPQVICPVFLGYFRAPNGEEDQTASVPAMLEMFQALGTAPSLKHAEPFATGAHSIGSPYKSPLAAQVAQASVSFLARKVGVSASRQS
ncbi:alpha/beta hydrolase [Pinirhizobacter soli]|uniref:alpha/beta hydrolase n=1 Tax=Pinirhizobacter soli TaxID=2786953 RepID=UPI002029DAFF|nr:alpha/beta fold hydrolase [Pinirhizobacter soli]